VRRVYGFDTVNQKERGGTFDFPPTALGRIMKHQNDFTVLAEDGSNQRGVLFPHLCPSIPDF
jgi:hypothetical protein